MFYIIQNYKKYQLKNQLIQLKGTIFVYRESMCFRKSIFDMKNDEYLLINRTLLKINENKCRYNLFHDFETLQFSSLLFK